MFHLDVSLVTEKSTLCTSYANCYSNIVIRELQFSFSNFNFVKYFDSDTAMQNHFYLPFLKILYSEDYFIQALLQ